MNENGKPRIAAIIPVGTLEGAKTRLGGSLDAEEREHLAEGFLARTVSAALAVDGLEDVLVVSPDLEVLRRAAELGARTLRQHSHGLNAGLVEARADVIAGGAVAILVLPIDLPFVTAASVRAIIEPLATPGPAGGIPVGGNGEPSGDRESSNPGLDAPIVVLVTDRHGTGTNALALRPPNVIDFAFGVGSRGAHRAAAGGVGVAYLEVDSPLSIDLDTPDDLVFVESLAAEAIGVD